MHCHRPRKRKRFALKAEKRNKNNGLLQETAECIRLLIQSLIWLVARNCRVHKIIDSKSNLACRKKLQSAYIYKVIDLESIIGFVNANYCTNPRCCEKGIVARKHFHTISFVRLLVWHVGKEGGSLCIVCIRKKLGYICRPPVGPENPTIIQTHTPKRKTGLRFLTSLSLATHFVGVLIAKSMFHHRLHPSLHQKPIAPRVSPVHSHLQLLHVRE